jgi:hypothetical protein
MMKMNVGMPLLGLLCALGLLGCATSQRNVLSTAQPWHGKLHQMNSGGSIIQTTVWEHGRLLSCWEYQTDKWTQTVTDGTGRRTLFDENGQPAGHEDFRNGDCVGGAG